MSRGWGWGWSFFLLAVALLFVVSSAEAATGALDPSFGTSGTVTTSLVGPEGASPANALLLQADGKIVAVGDSEASPNDVPNPVPQIALVRYNADGSQDSSFGSDGVVTTAIPGGSVYANAAALQPDGKIVVAGYARPHGGQKEFALLRYDPNGSLDPTFGTGGIVTTSVADGDSESFGLVLQPDGRIVAGGEVSDPSGIGSALVRYLPDGSLDPSFGTGGIVLATRAGESGFAAIALQSDGKLLGVGQSSGTLPQTDWGTTPLTRFNSDGTLDSSFGRGGVSEALTGSAAALALQPNGKIVVAGEQNSNSFLVSRVDPDGTADLSFGSGGTVTTPVGAGISHASAVALQPDAKIVVAGTSPSGFTVARYNPDGSLDPTFGRNGIVTTLSTVGPYWAGAGANAVALQLDGKIDAAGWSYFNGETGEQLSLARYLGRGGGMLTVCVVPRLNGRSLTAARHRITRAHCRIGTISHHYSKLKRGRVISQKPRAGRHLRNQSRITLVISKGKPA